MLWKLLSRFGRPYWGLALAVVLLQLISTAAMLVLPTLNARIIDDGVAVGDTDYIWRIGSIMLLVALLQLVATVASVWFAARAAMGLGRDLRRAIYCKVDELSSADINAFGVPTLITRSTNDVQQVQMLMLITLNFVVTVPILIGGGIMMALREDPGLSWLMWVSIPVLLIFVGLVVWQLMPLFESFQTRMDDVNGVLREQIMGIRVVRAFVREDFETQRLDAANRQLTEVSLRVGKLFVLLGPAISMLLHAATAAVLWFGGLRVADGLVEVGSLAAFMQYLLQILTAVMMGTFMVMMLPRALISGRRIGDVLATQPSIAEPETATVQLDPACAGRVEFRDVTFHYPGAETPVLEAISFTAEPGTTTAIIGATGSGKSTLIDLIPRLLDPSSGQVLVDGAPVSSLTRSQLTEAVGLVPQKSFLFSGTVADNLRFGAPDATDARLWQALEVAQGAEFVREREHGLDSPISQGGTNVSGGQRQRLCIARALVAQPRIYLFDDSFSALDVTTDAKLRAALGEHIADATIIMVAQRVSTITDADQILVLDAGRLVARGTHEDLLASSSVYREIVESQLVSEPGEEPGTSTGGSEAPHHE